MARTLAVVVKADIAAYQRAMQRASASTDNFTKKMAHVGRAGMIMSRLGDTLTRNVTLPILAVGVAATKMALDFDSSFTKMQTLAGVTGSEVDGLKDKVLGLSGETGRSPRELAEALYFLQSSGLDSAGAMAALEVSAKGAAAGLGPTEVIADAVSSAMLGYAESGLTAAEATDVLVATARAGKAEPAELAGQMGRLVPVASELGITFDQVGGSIAALSTKGFNAEQATTALTNVMSKLLKPSQLAVGLLDDVGLSVDDLRGMIAEKGLLGTLEELRARLGENGFVRFLEDQQAVQGGLALLGGDLNATKAIMDEVANSAGATEEAFEIWGKSLSGQTSRAIADFQVGLIRIGEVILPIAADVLSFAATIARAFGELPGPLQKAIVYFGLFLAAVGPVLSIGGRIMQTYAALGSAGAGIQTLTTKLGGLRAAAMLAAGVAGLAGVAVVLYQIGQAQQSAQLDKIAEKFAAVGDASNEAGIAAVEQADRWGQLDEVFGRVLESGQAQAERFIDMAEAAGVADDEIAAMRDRLDEKAAADRQGAEDAESNAAAVDGQAEAMLDAAGATEEAISALQEYVDTLKGMYDPQFAMVDALQASEDAQRELREATDELNAARESGDVERIAEAEERYAAATSGARRSVVDLQIAANELKDSMEAQGLTAEEVTGKFVDMAIEQGFTAEEALIMAEAFGIATEEADTLGKTDPNVRVSQTGSAAVRGDLSRVQQAAINTGRQKPNVNVRATDRASGVLGFIRSRINQLPTSKTITVQAVYRESGLASSTLGRALARQHGGPVKAGQGYIVGEKQPEYFVPDRDGTILPSVPQRGYGRPWDGGAGGGGGLGAVDVNLHITGNGVLAQQFMHGVRTGEIQLRVVGDKVRAR